MLKENVTLDRRVQLGRDGRERKARSQRFNFDILFQPIPNYYWPLFQLLSVVDLTISLGQG